jgi:ADP-L-glycero-D-manno-heptose 6-epimerase
MALICHHRVSGIFNLGTGRAHSFRHLVTALFRALGREPIISYFDMPPSIRERYQYFTEASIERLRENGYDQMFTPIDAAVADYATRFLADRDPYR